MTERKYDDGSVFEDGSEAVLMAVWYAMKWALRQQEKHGAWIAKHSGRRWWILRELRKRLDMQDEKINYRLARQEIADFARDYGVVQHGGMDLL